MTIFFLKANIEFEAENLDDAFIKVAQHFTNLSKEEPSKLILGGELTLEAIKNQKGYSAA